MSIDAIAGGTADTALVVLDDTTETTLIDSEASPLLIHSIAYACGASGDTLTLDSDDGTTAARLRQVAISANADGVFDVPFVLSRTHLLRGKLTTGNATAVRVTYSILNS